MAKIGRNTPCPCGSGKKYKHCCLRKEEVIAMPYTYADALQEVRNSTSWEDARASSIKKWEQIVGGDIASYDGGALCGFCFVKDNREESCSECPALLACDISLSAEDVLRMLQELVLPEEDNAEL